MGIANAKFFNRAVLRSSEHSARKCRHQNCFFRTEKNLAVSPINLTPATNKVVGVFATEVPFPENQKYSHWFLLPVVEFRDRYSSGQPIPVTSFGRRFLSSRNVFSSVASSRRLCRKINRLHLIAMIGKNISCNICFCRLTLKRH